MIPRIKPNFRPGIDPGWLRSSVQIQQISSSQDSMGQPVETWTAAVTTRAKIDAATQREAFQSGYIEQITHTVTMRRGATAIKPGMRVLFGSRIFKVQSIDNVLERNTLLKLMCIEINGPSQ